MKILNLALLVVVASASVYTMADNNNAKSKFKKLKRSHAALVTKVNDNTQAIEEIRGDTADVYNYSFNTNLTNRTFLDVFAEVPGECDHWVDTFSVNEDESLVTQTVSIKNSVDDIDCTVVNYGIEFNNNYVIRDFQYTTSGGNPIDLLAEFSNEWTYMKPQLRVGDTWGNFNTLTYSFFGGEPALNSVNGFDFRKRTVLGLESLTVPAGTFENCLVIEDERLSAGNSFTLIYYYCDGPGIARRIELTSGRDWQLQSYTEN